MLRLNLSGIQDPIVRENLRKIEEAFKSLALLNGDWTLIERNFTQSGVTVDVAHNLNFTPTDYLVLSAVGDQNFYFIPNDFNSSTIPIYISDPVNLRFLLGRAK